MRTAANVLENTVHFLCAMGYTNGEDQKRYQDRIWIEIISKKLHQTEKPYDPGHCYADQQYGAAQATHVEVDEDAGDQDRDGKENHHAVKAVDQIADQLTETDDMNADLVALEGADLVFTLIRELTVIQRLSGLRMLIEQRRKNHA